MIRKYRVTNDKFTFALLTLFTKTLYALGQFIMTDIPCDITV